MIKLSMIKKEEIKKWDWDFSLAKGTYKISGKKIEKIKNKTWDCVIGNNIM